MASEQSDAPPEEPRKTSNPFLDAALVIIAALGAVAIQAIVRRVIR